MNASLRSASLAGLVGLLGLALGLVACSPPDRSGEPPDLVLMVIDTLRADRLSVYGHGEARTPHVDRLAAEGVVFESATAPSPWTLPSVASLFTSTFTPEHGVVHDRRALPASFDTLAERVAALGYRTSALYVNPYAGPMCGLDRGFEESHRIGVHADRGLIEEWLETQTDEPFFLYVHNAEPHDPAFVDPDFAKPFGRFEKETLREIKRVTAGYRSLTRVDFNQSRALGTTDNAAEQAEHMARLDELRPTLEKLYDAAVSEADDSLGGVRQALEREGRFQHAVFVLVSDHGEEMGDHGGWQHDQSAYQELLHVPLVFRLPGGREGGRRVEEPVSLIDVRPTVLALLGDPEPERGGRGRSLVPLLEGESLEFGAQLVGLRENEKKYYRPYAEGRGDLNAVVREGSWKAIWNAQPESLELYDLATDAGERRDLSAEEPERAARLRAVAESALAELRQAAPPPVERSEELDAETTKALQHLGYVDGGDE